jgi:nuclear pore complex protein Nup155
MGLFAELKQAWITVDNRLYMWDYATGGGFQGYEENHNTITAIRLVKPKPGVFTSAVDYVLVVATTVNVFLIGLGCTANAKGTVDVQIFTTNMSVSTAGLDVTIIEGSPGTGRIFFGGKADNDIHEFTYQAEERWFKGRCSKVCHTNQGSSLFAPRIPFLSAPKDSKFTEQKMNLRSYSTD